MPTQRAKSSGTDGFIWTQKPTYFGMLAAEIYALALQVSQTMVPLPYEASLAYASRYPPWHADDLQLVLGRSRVSYITVSG